MEETHLNIKRAAIPRSKEYKNRWKVRIFEEWKSAMWNKSSGELQANLKTFVQELPAK
jgi:hypothetical protein